MSDKMEQPRLLNEPENDTERATILLMGLRRGGKSSICKVVFHNMQPLDTLYLESTSKPTTEHYSSLIDLAVMELPGQLNYFEPSYDSERLFKSVGALVYVIDSQDEYLNALTNLAMIIEYAYKVNPDIHIEVLIHKVDGLSEDFRLDTQRDIMQRIGDELLDLGIEGVQVSFHLTSIFDHSIYEAFSRITQKLIFELPSLENLLDNLVQHTKIEKSFLFDVNSKIYVATDSSPVDIQTYEVCAEFIDVTVDLNDLYESKDQAGQQAPQEQLKCSSVLQNGYILTFHKMIRGLALVALIKDTDVDSAMAIVDYNIDVFNDALKEIWKRSIVANHQIQNSNN
ncbi:CYFA0S04e02762g1_1 [Cyberlindnera fabianii]|uniref:GTP-binding protein n=1 Tax=Cyberlindnera fabianii TaxID=36022 RepID=A0A061ASC8_CYBFA|nr:CYFA0S04e02762g1_1 [Cyberlindnera fabianii]